MEETNFNATEKGWVKKHKIYSDIPVGTRGYFFNMREWPFDDKRVRYAFSYLYDRVRREKGNEEINRWKNQFQELDLFKKDFPESENIFYKNQVELLYLYQCGKKLTF